MEHPTIVDSSTSHIDAPLESEAPPENFLEIEENDQAIYFETFSNENVIKTLN